MSNREDLMHLRTSFWTRAHCHIQAEQGHTLLLDSSNIILGYAANEVCKMKDAFGNFERCT